MAQTQQYDALNSTSGIDLASKLGWATVGNAGATTGNFTMYSSASPSASNAIIGAYHKPANAATKTGANIARAFFTAGAGGILTETGVAVSVEHRASSAVNGSGDGWPNATAGSDLIMGVIVRASGTAYASHNWYEMGFSTITGQSTGTLIIRRVNAGTTTTVASTSIALPFKYPSYSSDATPNLTPANVWAKITGSAVNSGGNVLLEVKVTIQDTSGTQVVLSATDSSGSKITSAGYGGFWTSGNAATSGSLWSHFQNFLLSVTTGGIEDVVDPTDANTEPSLTADAALSSITVAKEQDSGTVVPTLAANPTYAIPVDIKYETNEAATDAGYVITQPRFPVPRRVWRLRWDAMKASDFASLVTQLEGRNGAELAVSWTPPLYGVAVKMIAVEGAFTYRQIDVSTYAAECTLMEVYPT